jgi:hypothetical protein
MFTGISGSKHFFSASSMTFCSRGEREEEEEDSAEEEEGEEEEAEDC